MTKTTRQPGSSAYDQENASFQKCVLFLVAAFPRKEEAWDFVGRHISCEDARPNGSFKSTFPRGSCFVH